MLAGIVSWLTYRVNTLSTPPQKEMTQTTPDENADLSVRVTSGKKVFDVNLPEGWGPIHNATDTDYLAIGGKEQPDIHSGKPPMITSGPMYGGDSPVLFSMGVYKKNGVSPPEGEGRDFKIGDLKGKKYRLEYTTEDYTQGLGTHLKGDIHYDYEFTLKDKRVLRVWYSVYASDPRNLVETVDELVRSINIL